MIFTSKNSSNPKLSTKTNCQAKMNVIIGSDEKFTISHVHFDHNHVLSPQKSNFKVQLKNGWEVYYIACNGEIHFFHLIDIDEESSLKNAFWVDARCIAVYEVFGDVIPFGTTYLTNKYDMPFAPFVGVNYYGNNPYYLDVVYC